MVGEVPFLLVCRYAQMIGHERTGELPPLHVDLLPGLGWGSAVLVARVRGWGNVAQNVVLQQTVIQTPGGHDGDSALAHHMLVGLLVGAVRTERDPNAVKSHCSDYRPELCSAKQELPYPYLTQGGKVGEILHPLALLVVT